MEYGQIKLQNKLEDQFCIYNPLIPGIPKPECGGIRKASLWAKGLYPGEHQMHGYGQCCLHTDSPKECT